MTPRRTLAFNVLLMGIVTLLMIAISIAGVARTLAFYTDWTTYEAQASSVEGRVLKLNTHFWLRNYFITYRYEDSKGETFTQEEQVPRRIYNDVAEGNAITLLYDPERPADLRIQGNNRELIRFSLTTVGWIVATLIALVSTVRVIRAERAIHEYNKEQSLTPESEIDA